MLSEEMILWKEMRHGRIYRSQRGTRVEGAVAKEEVANKENSEGNPQIADT